MKPDKYVESPTFYYGVSSDKSGLVSREDIISDPTEWEYIEGLIIKPAPNETLSLSMLMAIHETYRILQGYKAFS